MLVKWTYYIFLYIYIYTYNLNYGWHAFETWILDDTRSRNVRQKAFFFSFFFLRKLLESCGYLAEHLLERLHVQGGVVVLRAHWLNHLSQFFSSQPLALPDRTRCSSLALVPFPETYSLRVFATLSHRAFRFHAISHRFLFLIELRFQLSEFPS